MIGSSVTTPQLHLEDVVDIATMQRIQDTFSQAMGFAAVIVNRAGQPVTRLSNFLPICRLIRSSPKGRARCWECDAEHGLQAYKSGRSCSYLCHAGLLDAAAPIVIEGEYLGSILCGQTILSDSQEEAIDRILECTAPLGLPQAKLKRAAQNVPMISEQRLNAAVEMLSLTANHIVEIGVANLTQAKLLQENKMKAALQTALKNTQLRALQSQLNPHFLFNSLTLIGYTAMQENAPQTEEIVYCLSDLLRYSLQNMAKTVRLGEELDMIERYLTIQQLRFGSRLDVKIEIDPGLHKVRIPCMILQPVVENAVVHAVEPLTRPVSVRIRVARQPAGLLIEVIDDGAGMDDKIAAAINAGKATRINGKRPSLGLRNVAQRLEGEYRGQACIRIETRTGEGTRVLISLPV